MSMIYLTKRSKFADFSELSRLQHRGVWDRIDRTSTAEIVHYITEQRICKYGMIQTSSKLSWSQIAAIKVKRKF